MTNARRRLFEGSLLFPYLAIDHINGAIGNSCQPFIMGNNHKRLSKAVAQIKTQLVVQPKLTAPLKKGQVIGIYVATLDGKVIAEKPLVALQEVEEAGFFARMLDHIKQFFSNLF